MSQPQADPTRSWGRNYTWKQRGWGLFSAKSHWLQAPPQEDLNIQALQALGVSKSPVQRPQVGTSSKASGSWKGDPNRPGKERKEESI